MKSNPLKIVLADDDEADRLLFIEAFDELNAGTYIQTVNDGVELMKLLLQTAIENLPDILFLDINMPKKNGLDCLKEIRSNKKFQEVSIAIFTTSSSQGDMENTFLLGANVYINKPNNFQKLKKILEKSLSYASVYQEPPFNMNNFILNVE
ncbi:response regulator [Belliella sp. DSM 111904]|uniref:Response regulator n=1 Tax=Belliella filtrata TaxID=2923435 RepID=A0ABS9V4M5_9BACT|nr:response regulator [Belliella filtrata]MCH7411367.1 response regulator [Belliella filtrata]